MKKNILFLLPIITIIIWLIPITTFYTKVFLIIFFSGSFLTGVYKLWLFCGMRMKLLFLVVIIVIFVAALVLPDREYQPSDLNDSFLNELLSYQGTPYVWGGEGHLGVDCSGLIRASLIGASIKLGFFTVNPKLIRFGVSLWWYDATARQIGQGYRNLTYYINKVNSLNSIDYSIIKPGDLAVTASGIHILAYIGKNSWIEADPNFGKVIVLDTPQLNNPWFSQPVRIVRFIL